MDGSRYSGGKSITGTHEHSLQRGRMLTRLFQDLIEHGPPNVLLLRENPNENHVCGTFDYSDLNAYLLVVVGLANPDENQVEVFSALARKAREGKPIPLREIQTLAKKAPLVTMDESENLSGAIEHFGSGIHRILVCNKRTTEVVGILSQLKLVRFLWDNGSNFPAIDRLYSSVIRDLNIGTPNAIAINGDRPLTDALTLMSNEGLTSLAVVDNAYNVVGNISTADVKLLTKTSSLPLLHSSCIHFISVILTERGTLDGKDSFPGKNYVTCLLYTVLILRSVSCFSSVNIGTYGCKVSGHKISPYVGR